MYNIDYLIYLEKSLIIFMFLQNIDNNPLQTLMYINFSFH